jgi:hypothetical protein
MEPRRSLPTVLKKCRDPSRRSQKRQLVSPIRPHRFEMSLRCSDMKSPPLHADRSGDRLLFLVILAQIAQRFKFLKRALIESRWGV